MRHVNIYLLQNMKLKRQVTVYWEWASTR